MAEAGSADKTIRNAISYLRRYLMKPSGRSDGDPVGAELCEDFASSLDHALMAAGSNQRAVRASLKQWKSSFDQLHHSQGLPDDFTQALQELFRRHDLIVERGFQTTKVARLAGIKQQALSHWVHGSTTPSLKSKKSIQCLEVFFGLPAGTLFDRLSDYGIYPNRTAQAKKGDASPYCLKEDEISPSLEGEIRSLVLFKTAPTPPPGMNRNEAWKVKPLNEHGDHVYPLGLLPNDRYAPTSRAVIQAIRLYLGYLHREKGIPLDSLSLALFAKADWIYDYLQFLSDRAGRHTTNLVGYLNSTALPLLHTEFGFVVQRKDLAALHPDGISQSEWKNFCTLERDKILKLKRDLERGRTLEIGRDPEECIEAILRSDDPISWLIELESRLSSSPPPQTTAPVGYTCWMRDRLLVRLLISNPLRKNQIQTITWRPDNTGELRQDQDGQWWLVFEARRFKNDRFAVKKKYQAPVDGWVADLIPQYLEEVRPNLYGSDDCDYLFLPSKKGNGDRSHFSTLNDRLLGVTQKYLPDVAPGGFRTHSFRHIIATGMLKKGSTIDEVASVLHDTPDTVRRAYGHLVESDGTKALGKYLAALRRKHRPSRPERRTA
jgi:integrase/transcriptional regulator with XRE-family HTH domain